MTSGPGTVLRAGGLRLTVDGGMVRDLRWHGIRLLDAVYAGVRPPDWSTADDRPALSDSDQGPASFSARIATRAGAESGVDWEMRLLGTPESCTISFTARALRPVAVRRVGLNLLLPAELRGDEWAATTGDGVVQGRFPDLVDPGPLFTDAVGLRVRTDGLDANLEFDGGRFECEDHRNWSDPGWKAYTPPLAAGPPDELAAGDVVTHIIRITARRTTPPRVDPGHSPGARGRPTANLPGLSVDHDSTGVPELLPAGLDLHVRLDPQDDWTDRLGAAAERAGRSGCGLQISLAGPDEHWLSEVATQLRALGGLLTHVAVLDQARPVPEPAAIQAVRELLHGVPAAIGGGSQLHFAELNRADLNRADLNRAGPNAVRRGFVQFPVTPQVHHTTTDLILGCGRAGPAMVATARHRAPHADVIVAPLRFRARHDPFSPAGPTDRPDDRDGSPAHAAWLLAAIAGFVDADRIVVQLDAPPSGDPGPTWSLLAWLAARAGQGCAVLGQDQRDHSGLRFDDGSSVLADLTGTTRHGEDERAGADPPYGITYREGDTR